jgi:MYXO-CTERM domain-containing protein
MTEPDRRSLNLGVGLLALGGFFLLRRELHFRGPGPILVLLGVVFLAISALRQFRGPVLPAGVLLGLGAGFLLRDPLERWMPGWATLLLGLGSGLLLAAALERSRGRDRRPGPLVPGAVLVTIAVAAALARNLRMPESLYDAAWRLWPWVLVAAGVILVLQAARARRT